MEVELPEVSGEPAAEVEEGADNAGADDDDAAQKAEV